MRKQAKRFLSAFLAVIMALTFMPVGGALAAEGGQCGDNLTWTLDGDGTLTISGTGEMYDWKFDNPPWYGIRESIKTIVIEDGVTSIGDSSFSDLDYLTGVVISNTVKTIGDEAFRSCGRLESIDIPGSVESIGLKAISGCSSMLEITVDSANENYLSVDGVLFSVNDDRTLSLVRYPGRKGGEYTVPDNVTRIISEAFADCYSLTSVKIGSNVTNIGSYAFGRCYSLTGIEVSADNSNYSSLDGVLFNKDKTELIQHPYGNHDDYTVPDSVTTIGFSAFDTHEQNHITLGANVSVISDYAFDNAYNINSVELPDSVTSIGSYAFYNCESLTELKIGSGVTSVYDMAFENTGLTSVIIPRNVTEIGSEAFGYKNNGKKVNGFIVYGFRDTTAEKYASENGFEFQSACFHSSDSMSKFDEVPATCTEIGYTAGTYCNECKEWIEGHDIIPAQHIDSDEDGICDICGKNAEPTIRVDESKYIEVTAGETTYVKFIPEVSGKYTFTSYSQNDTYGYLFDANKKIITYDDDSGEDNNFLITETLEAGKLYYYGVKFFDPNLTDKVRVVLTDGSAVGRGICGTDLIWTLKSDGTLVIDGTGKMHDWVGNEVVPWSYYNDRIKSVVLRSGVTNIGSRAFKDCENIESVTVPDGVERIGDYAFFSCAGLKNITIPNGVTKIGYMAFCGSGLTSVKLPTSVKHINNTAIGYYYDSAADNAYKNEGFVIYGYTGTAAEKYANDNGIDFQVACRHSSEAYTEYDGIPATCTENGFTAGVYCNECKDWISGREVIDAHHTDGNDDLICDICGEKVMLSIKSGETKSVDVLAGETTYIEFIPEHTGKYEFTSHSSSDTYGYLFDENMEELTYDDDSGESNNFLMNVDLEADTTYYWGVKLCDRSISEKVTVSLTEISDRPSVEKSGQCGENLTWELQSDGTLVIGGTGKMYDREESDDVPWLEYGESIKTVVIEDGVEEIGDYSFLNCADITSVSIPNSVTVIGDNVFESCLSLTNIAIPDGVTAIGEGLFFNCESLTGAAIPNGVTKIGDYAFYGCLSLTDITVPENVTSMGNAVFYNCKSLTDITVAVNNPNYSSSDGVLFNKDKTELIQYPCGKTDETYTIPNSVKTLENFAFSRNDSLKSVTIPDSVTAMGSDVFSFCQSLESMTIPNSITEIGDGSFSECTALTSVTIPDSVTVIGGYAFYNCVGLSEIEIPDSVTELEYGAFSGCGGLTEITIPNSVTKIGAYVFYGCGGLTQVEIPNGVTMIEEGTFWYCRGLVSVTVPDSVTIIEKSAFYFCESLKSLTIPAGVTSIGKQAFGYHFDNETNDDKVYDGVVIYGTKGTAAERYATDNGIRFVEVHTHSYTPTVTEKATCSKAGKITYTCSCGDTYIETVKPLGHKPIAVSAVAPTCTKPGKTAGEKCSVCGEILVAQEDIKALGHKPVAVSAVAPTCTKPGKTAGEKCSVCGEITKASQVIKATGHKYTTLTSKATATRDGSVITKCTVCGAVKSKTVIAKASSVKLSKTSFTYNGKTQKPSVTVKDSKGRTLKNGTDYTVKYSSGCKNVGQYTVTVTFKGKYSGTKKLTFKIVPKGTSISKLTAGKKQFTAKWSKQTAQTTGYELQYSTKSSMSGAKTVNVGKNKTTSSTVKKLKSGKKYYVRIRTYKTVKVNGKSVKLYSSWSKVKNVKTK